MSYSISFKEQENLLDRISAAGQKMKQDGSERLDILVFVYKELERIQEAVPLANEPVYRQLVRERAIS